MSHLGQINIGPLRLKLQGEGLRPVRYSEPGYRNFFSRGGARRAPEPLAILDVDLVPRATPLPAAAPLWRRGQCWAVWDQGADLLCCAGFQEPGRARYGCRVARDLSRAELALDPAWLSRHSDGLEAPLHYPLDQFLAWGMLSRLGGALVHGAAAVHEGTGWVFAGRSGAGKSTLAGLCHAQGWRILNDDRAMVFRRGGEWRVAGTPWHGSGCFAEAEEAPLGGLFLLRQAATERVQLLPAVQARLAMLDVAAVPWFEDSWAQGTLDGLNRLVREIKPAQFHFTKTAAAVEALAGEGALA